MTLDPNVTAAILAGGRGRRLGGIDKSALIVGTQSILERQLGAVAGLTPHILIVAGDRSRFQRAAVQVVEDLIPGTGSLGGLYSALKTAATEQVLVIACDMPFLTTPFLARLVALGAGRDAAIPRDARGRHPLCASYATCIAEGLKSRIDVGDLRIGEALNGLDVRDVGPEELAPFDPEGLLLLNINTPSEYAIAKAAARRESPVV
jgi:molybdopterin-guanine dinucleotide biosynthesis protein A